MSNEGKRKDRVNPGGRRRHGGAQGKHLWRDESGINQVLLVGGEAEVVMTAAVEVEGLLIPCSALPARGVPWP